MNTRVLMQTTLGDMTIELEDEKAPITVENFLAYVDEGFFEGLIFHRVIHNFMLQGGGMTPDFERKAPSRPNIQNEANNGLFNKVGTLAMARTGEPHSASSQFFINAKDNHFLNHTEESAGGWGYCVFGTVVDGLEAMEKIRDAEVEFDPRADSSSPAKPIDPIIINKITRLEPNS